MDSVFLLDFNFEKLSIFRIPYLNNALIHASAPTIFPFPSQKELTETICDLQSSSASIAPSAPNVPTTLFIMSHNLFPYISINLGEGSIRPATYDIRKNVHTYQGLYLPPL